LLCPPPKGQETSPPPCVLIFLLRWWFSSEFFLGMTDVFSAPNRVALFWVGGPLLTTIRKRWVWVFFSAVVRPRPFLPKKLNPFSPCRLFGPSFRPKLSRWASPSFVSLPRWKLYHQGPDPDLCFLSVFFFSPFLLVDSFFKIVERPVWSCSIVRCFPSKLRGVFSEFFHPRDPAPHFLA